MVIAWRQLDLTDENLLPLIEDHPQSLLVLVCDVSDPVQVNQAVEATRQRWGRVDILVNNAALAVFEPFEEKLLELTRREFEVNYFGCLNTIAAMLPLMKAQGEASSTTSARGLASPVFLASTATPRRRAPSNR
jgi:NAD(P)-dependent dehydrogenase (short-subunit alcohol dehydrogenase family)